MRDLNEELAQRWGVRVDVRAGVATGEVIASSDPGGPAVISIPFLQPYHACPGDYRRYTSDGLVALGAQAGLATVALNPVHSAAQTLGWIAWAIAQEKGRLARALVWPIVFVWTRLSLGTDPRVVRNANTYQIVFRRS